MLYKNKRFTLPACTKQMTTKEWEKMVGKKPKK